MNSLSLADALKNIDLGETIGIFDSDRTDGRFLLYTLASSGNHDITWISCSPSGTERNLMLAMKRIGKGHGQNMSEGFIMENVINVTSDIAQVAMENEKELNFDGLIRSYISRLAHRIKKIVDECKTKETIHRPLIVIDDISELATLFGRDNLAVGFLQCLLSITTSVIFRASMAIDQKDFFRSIKDDWLDGMNAMTKNSDGDVWERGLLDFCDTWIDVVPLESGFSREAHGRVIISNSTKRETLNYVCNDYGVRAIRMHKER